jgi:hypothetical protein
MVFRVHVNKNRYRERYCFSRITSEPRSPFTRLFSTQHIANMSGSGKPTGLDLSENKGPNILAPMWALTMIMMSLVCARIFIRARVVKKVGFDDWIIMVSMVRIIDALNNILSLYTDMVRRYRTADGSRLPWYHHSQRRYRLR